MIHTHHIVPKHMGGTDHPDNLVQLTIAEHADAHNLLYSLHKNPRDKLAELVLLGQAKDPEAMRIKARLGGATTGKQNLEKAIAEGKHGAKQGYAAMRAKYTDEEYSEMQAKRCRGRKHSEETKRKMSLSAKNRRK